MTNFFNILPGEVITGIAKSLDMKTLCNLIMTSKEFKKLCDTNDIWKYHYLLTIKDKWKITENSVHIWGANPYIYLYEFNDGCDIYKVKSFQNPRSQKIQDMNNPFVWDYSKNVKFIKNLGKDPYISWFDCWNRPWYHDHTSNVVINGCSCMCHQSLMLK